MTEENQATTEEQDELDTAIFDAFSEAIDSNASEDEVKMAMISAGATFKNVTRLYNGFMIDAGMAVSREERDEIVDRLMKDADVSTEDSFDAKVSEIAEAITGATEKSAANYIRAYCKKHDLEVFKKVGSGKTRQDGFRFKFYDALKANPAMTEEEAKKFGSEFGSENDKKAFSHYQAIRELVNVVSGNAKAKAA